MKTKFYFAMSALLLLASCGQQHKAESVVEGFMDKNLRNPDKLQITEFTDMDSTRHINDSTIHALRAAVGKSSVYKKNTEFDNADVTPQLKIIRVKYKIEDAEYHDTYYLDSSLEHVIMLKSNIALEK